MQDSFYVYKAPKSCKSKNIFVGCLQNVKKWCKINIRNRNRVFMIFGNVWMVYLMEGFL